jgi:transcriptional regulator with XRE-family HTH domain
MKIWYCFATEEMAAFKTRDCGTQKESHMAEEVGSISPKRNRLGSMLRQTRKSLGLRLVDVARIADYTPSYISKIELGQIPDGPSDDACEAIAKALEIKDVNILLRLKAADKTSPDGDLEVEDLPWKILTQEEQELLILFRASSRRVQEIMRIQLALITELVGESPKK